MKNKLSNIEQAKYDLIDTVAALVQERLSPHESQQAENFVRQFFDKVPPKDILQADKEKLYGSALAYWRFAHQRKPGESLVRVYNPNLEEHGWLSDHTVVEICTDDRPFLVDSATVELVEQGMTIFMTIHPVIKTCRDLDGKLKETKFRKDDFPESKGHTCQDESFMLFLVNRQSGGKNLEQIAERLQHCLSAGRVAVDDWPKMRERASDTVAELGKNQPKPKSDQAKEICDFIQWLHDDHFTFLGTCDFEAKSGKVIPVKDTALGIMALDDLHILDEMCDLAMRPVGKRSVFMENDDTIMVVKSSHKSDVHRSAYMDVIFVKRFGPKGKVIGQRVFIGLFTSAAYNRSPIMIPMIRLKCANVMERAGYAPGSHNRKSLANIIDTFPRDELIQVSEETLYDMSMGILNLQERQRVALFVREDDFSRHVSCQIFVPRDNFTTELRQDMQAVLESTFEGDVLAFYTTIADAPLARLHVIVSTPNWSGQHVDFEKLEEKLIEVSRNWNDQLRDQLVVSNGEEKGLKQFRRYQDAFPISYREEHTVQIAIGDIAKLDSVLKTGELELSLYRPIEYGENQLRFKLYHPHGAVPLSHVLPMLENMGLRVMDEHPYLLHLSKGDIKRIMIHDFGLETASGDPVDLSAIRENFQTTFRQIWNSEVENDGFNELVIQAGILPWSVMLLRACCKYLRQANIPFSQDYMQRALSKNPEVTRRIVDLFYIKFDPNLDFSEKQIEKHRESIQEVLEGVKSADEDRILRRFLNLVDCILRTNFFQSDEAGQRKPYVSFKLNSRELEDLPLPRPWREIFVYSPRIEGIHLRYGAVARGGLRWSDRPEDFRTEILGLVKAQQVKNAVIVPVGSKGGFVVKQPPSEGGREAYLKEGIECYKTFIRGLLDLTDNYLQGEIIAPKQVVRRDDDDPYLVVAADKGTATFSDIANGVSLEYGHWLGDAFASGGSDGYDHKKMGITAKGAWESVKRHFRELGKNIQEEEFTVAGVGDMGGDVFGNGMLLSKHIRLVAAFNHLHIFIDPNPDAASSWTERKRLFDEVKGWDQYDTSKISKGGGVFERSAKRIDLTPEIAKALSIPSTTKSMTPTQLIQAILKAEVELMWFGGIGTYIKASHESDADTGDRGNDAIRVNASDLRCKVVGEGANLGATQRGRIEFARAGGAANTDFIDNAGGVDCSDHEVNIKILLNQVVAAGDMTMKQRNVLLEQMTDEVSDLVLRDNYLQTQAISLVRSRALELLDHQSRLMKFLEKQGRLDRDVEVLPNDEVLNERQAHQKGLTRPELSVLLPYAKIWLYDQLLASDLPDDPQLEEDLIRYFPTPLRKKFKDQIAGHMLRREIIATHITNSLINRVGGSFVTRVMENTSATPDDIARAYLITRDSFQLRQTWADIEALDNQVAATEQIRMLQYVNRLVDRGTNWFLKNGPKPLEIGRTVQTFAPGLEELACCLEEILPENMRTHVLEEAQTFIQEGVPEALAKTIAGSNIMVSGCDIVEVAHHQKLQVRDVAEVYFAAGNRFELGWMRATGDKLGLRNHWQKLAVFALIEDVYAYQSTLTHKAIETMEKGDSPLNGLQKWLDANANHVAQTDAMLSEMRTTKNVDFAMLTVMAKQIRDMLS